MKTCQILKANMFPKHVQQLLATFFGEHTNVGVTTLALREAVSAYAAALNGGQREVSEIPSTWEPYVKKVALYAYKVTDKDIVSLKAAGYSEDEIFEVTLSAAIGASIARWEVGLKTLEESKTAQ